MTIFISRDYSASTTGYASNKFYTPVMYELSLFLYRILGYSVVGHTGWNLDALNTTLTVSAASNTVPIQITTTTSHGLSTGQTVVIAGVGGNTNAIGTWVITVTGATTFALVGSSGIGAYTSGGTVTAGFLYTSGLISDGYGTGINFGTGVEKEISIPVFKRKVVAGDVGKMLVLKSAKYPTKNTGCFKISAINVGNNTTIAVASNGQSLPQATITVASTTGFPSSGTIFVTTSTGTSTVTYTGTTGTTFTGCSGGTGSMSTGGALANLNRYVIDYRSTENPPAEASNTIDWWLYEVETTVSNFLSNFTTSSYAFGNATNTTPIQITGSSGGGIVTGQQVVIVNVGGNTAANGTWTITATGTNSFTLNGSVGNGTYTASSGTYTINGYPGDGYSYNSRIILQSPHSTGWQVRIAAEPVNTGPNFSVTTGFGGNSIGDFPVGGLITNIVQTLDVNPISNTTYNNLTVGGGHNTTANRMTVIGDNTGQNVFVYTRTLGATNNGLFSFGIPDNEPTPLSVNSNRMYCYGSSAVGDFGNIILKIGTPNNVGFAVQNGNIEFCALTGWANLDGTSATSPLLSASAADSVFTGSTEVLPIEIWGGINTDIATVGGTNYPFNYAQRFMGTAPFLRNGRTNFSAFTISTDEVTNRTITAATNASPIQITTSAANALTTGQTVTISGVLGNTAANGTWVITVINSTNFTLTGSIGNGAYTSGGTVNGCPRWLHLQNGIYLQWNGPSGLNA